MRRLSCTTVQAWSRTFVGFTRIEKARSNELCEVANLAWVVIQDPGSNELASENYCLGKKTAMGVDIFSALGSISG